MDYACHRFVILNSMCHYSLIKSINKNVLQYKYINHKLFNIEYRMTLVNGDKPVYHIKLVLPFMSTLFFQTLIALSYNVL